MKTKIFSHGRQFVDQKDIKEVVNSLNSSFLTNGPYVKKFEEACKKKLNSKYAFSCNSGTSSIMLAFLAADLKENDSIIMPAINFIASANIARNLKAKVYFADIDYNTGQMTPKNVVDCMKLNKIKKVKLILTMYLGGYPRNINEFYNLKKKLKCILIEDACHAFGGEYKHNNKTYKIGSCKHSDISTFSFHPLKTITTGEGGFLTTNKNSLAKKINLIKSHGIIRDPKKHWKYSIEDLGFNFRLSDINAALGLSQMKKINTFLSKRKEVSNLYTKHISDNYNFITLPKYSKKNNSGHHLFVVHLDFKKLKITKDQLFSFLLKRKIFVQYHYIPQYYFKVFNNNMTKNQKFYGAEKFYNSALSLPIYPYLKNKEIIYILESIKKFISKK